MRFTVNPVDERYSKFAPKKKRMDVNRFSLLGLVIIRVSLIPVRN